VFPCLAPNPAELHLPAAASEGEGSESVAENNHFSKMNILHATDSEPSQKNPAEPHHESNCCSKQGGSFFIRIIYVDIVGFTDE
jgi:hypothetical protein